MVSTGSIIFNCAYQMFYEKISERTFLESHLLENPNVLNS